jgi:hypothetical protein
MFDDDLGAGLTALAEHAGRTGHLADAASVRARADGRRRRRHVAAGALGAVLLGVLGVGVARGLPRGHGTPQRPAAPASDVPTAPRPIGMSSPPPLVAKGRQVHLLVLYKGTEVPGSLVNALPDRRLGVGSDRGQAGLFAPWQPEPGRNEYEISAFPQRVGAAMCMAVTAKASGPSPVVVAECDATAPTRRFAIDDLGPDNQGRTMYAIRHGDAYLRWRPGGPAGFVADRLGGAPPDTTFVMVDQGRYGTDPPAK